MENIKRSRNNTTYDYNGSKRRKTTVTTDENIRLTQESISVFEDLSNELIYEIFDFLDFHHAFQGFYNLNERFRNLFVYSNLPIKINVSSISKSTFQHYLTDIIIPHTHRIKSLRLSSPFAAEMSLLLFPIMTNLTRLKTLTINNIESSYIEEVVNHLSSLPVLSSLTITSIDNIQYQNNIYHKIFRLPTLKYCQILIETKKRLQTLSMATNEFSPIEHLVINNEVSLNQLDSILSYIPQLRCLSFGHLDGRHSYRIHKSSTIFNYLTNVSLKLHSISFNDFERLVTDFFRQVQVLRIEVTGVYFSVHNPEYLDADRWEQLISTHILNLRIFDLHHECRSWYGGRDHQEYEAQINKFNLLFWLNHQWFFEQKYYKKKYFNELILNSTNTYGRKDYILSEKLNKDICSPRAETNLSAVHHVCIHNINAIKQFVGDFPNATEVILSEMFDVPRDSLATDLNRIIPLRQLTKLTLDCHRLPFEHLVELLYFTPNIHTLKLDSILLYRTNTVSIQQNEVFQMVSSTNTITNVTIIKECTLDKIQLLTALFPRLEYLTMNFYKEDLESIAQFLLSQFNDNTRHLSSLCVLKRCKHLMEKLKNLIESENLLNDYTIKGINQKLYLWW